ncbi:MAG: hypothetical protein M1497_14270 [Nitrospirae bacterium]|nr:hypothetical protein [Nitrospirota bacterium]
MERERKKEQTGAEAGLLSGPQGAAALAEGAIRDHRKLRAIVSLLYGEKMEERLVAAKALGEIARRVPDLMRQRWERIFRAFDDTMSCWGAAEALGEIARNLPEQRRKIELFLKGFRKDECSCQGYIWGMCRICQVEMERTREFAPELIGFLGSQNVCMTGQAIWAIGELGIREASDKVESFLRDERETWVFENDSACVKSIGRIAEEALRKLARSGDAIQS